MFEYKTRIADALLKRKLTGKGAVLIEGPKWCGKTTTAEQIAGSVIYMDDPQHIVQGLQWHLDRFYFYRRILGGILYDKCPSHT